MAALIFVGVWLQALMDIAVISWAISHHHRHKIMFGPRIRRVSGMHKKDRLD